MQFEVLNASGFARRGRLTLQHGVVETPVFMPVGTLGVVKTLSPDELLSSGSQIILGNSYHLNLRPGMDILKTFGGLHNFMNWGRPILTDSGGFQVFSLGRLKKVTDDGVTFQSHLNGDLIHITPEISAQIQRIIGADIAMVFDECVSLPNEKTILQKALIRSFDWAQRFLKSPKLPGQAVFGIIQGGTELDLRTESLQRTQELDVEGIAIGGLSVGESFDEMIRVLDHLSGDLMPPKPHYLMGVGTPRDLLEGVRRGIDMFDCVLPTRNARNGGLFTDHGLLNIRNSKYSHEKAPIEEGCPCPACQNYSLAYLRHLFNVKEILGLRLATLHNLYYYHRFMREIRESLQHGTFETFYQSKSALLRDSYPSKEMK